MAIELTIEPMTQTVPVDGQVVFTATFTPDETVTPDSGVYAWYVDGQVVSDETASTFTKTFDTVATVSVKCEVTYTLVADGTATVEQTASINVIETPRHWFIHPLEFKNSSFSWVPYWIHDWMVANPNWRSNPLSSPWPHVTYAIDLAVTTYGECLMQESRNGYIYKASAYAK